MHKRFDKLTNDVEISEERLAKNIEEINNKKSHIAEKEQEIENIKEETEKLNYIAKELVRKEKLYTESAIKKEEKAKLVEEEANTKAKKIIDDALIEAEKAHEPTRWQKFKAWIKGEMVENPYTAFKTEIKRRYENWAKSIKEENSRFAEEKKKDKEIIKAYQLKFGDLNTPKNEATLDKNNDISVKPKYDGEDGSGGGSYGM